MAYDGEKDHVLIKKLQDELREECGRDTEQIVKDVKSKQEIFNREVNKTICIMSVYHKFRFMFKFLNFFQIFSK